MSASKKRLRDAEPAPAPPAPIGSAAFPGDYLCKLGALDNSITLGPGVVRDGGHLYVSVVGIVRWEPSSRRLWIEGEPRRYVPATGDHVIGVIADKNAEEYRLQIGAAANASLPVLGFDGATKRNRPHLDVGALVYARVTLAHRDMEPEVTCAAPPGVGAKDWVTNESVFGELKGGHLFNCPQPLCRRLMSDDCLVLDALGGLAPFELAVGINGRVWISSSAAAMVVLSQMAILQSQGVPEEEHAALVESLSEAYDLSDFALAEPNNVDAHR
jgi:exosome complex component RRP40